MEPDKPIVLYSPGEAPMFGMVSSLDPAGLAKGQWRLIDNWQISRNSMQGRLGCDELTNGVLVASASFKGAWAGKLNGTEYVVLALRVSSETRVYKIADPTASPWTGTELTTNAPTNTRFATDGNVVFAPYRELGLNDGVNDASDYLYMSNGTADVPRASRSMLNNSVDFLFNLSLSAISQGSYRPIPKGYVFINDSAKTTPTVSDADVVAADVGTAPDSEISFTAGTAVDVGDYGNIAFGTNSCVNISGNTETTGDSLDLSTSLQLGLLLHDSSSDPIFNYCNVEVTQDAGQVQVYDASGAGRIDPAVTPIGNGYYFAAFNLEKSVASTLDEVTGVRLEFARVLTATRTVKVAGVFAMGRVPQGSIYQYSFSILYSRVESASIVPKAQPPAALSEYGVARTIPFKYPDVPQFFYQYRIDWGGTKPSVAAGLGVDACLLYRQQPGDAKAFFVCDMGVSNNPFNDNVEPNTRFKSRPAPSPGGRGPLSGSAVEPASDRLFVGGITGAKDQYWASDEFFPLRFNALATDEDLDGIPDPGSGIAKTLPGEEVTKIVKMPGTFVGISPIIVFTNLNTYRIEGIDSASIGRPGLVNPHGTLYPNSVWLYRGVIIYLDSDLVTRVLAGGINGQDISTNRVDDQSENNVMTNAAGYVWKEQYGLAHAASGASINQRVMSYDLVEDKWCRHSYTAAEQNWLQFVIVGSGSSRKLVGFTAEGRVYQILKAGQTDDDGTAITGTLTTGEMHDDMWQQRVWGSVCVLTDAISGGTWTITRTDENDNTLTGSGTGTINVAASVTRAYLWEKSSGTGLVRSGIKTSSARISISGKVQNGKYLKFMGLSVPPDSGLVPKGSRT